MAKKLGVALVVLLNLCFHKQTVGTIALSTSGHFQENLHCKWRDCCWTTGGEWYDAKVHSNARFSCDKL